MARGAVVNRALCAVALTFGCVDHRRVLTLVGVLDPATLSQYGRLDLLIAMERLKS